MTGPLRAGALPELLRSPQAFLEAGIGLAASIAAMVAGMEVGVPGAPRRWRLFLPTAILMSAWLGIIAYGVSHPALENSMLGKREHCFIQSLIFATPPYFLALRLLRERLPEASLFAGLLVGAAAAAIPALWMQMACMHDPVHAMKFHLTPVLALGLVGALMSQSAKLRN